MQISRLTLVAALEGTAPRYRKMCSNWNYRVILIKKYLKSQSEC
jgi:hypothetical protein